MSWFKKENTNLDWLLAYEDKMTNLGQENDWDKAVFDEELESFDLVGNDEDGELSLEKAEDQEPPFRPKEASPILNPIAKTGE